MRFVQTILLILSSGIVVCSAAAQSSGGTSSSIKILGRSETVVTEQAIRLSDIAQIDSPRVQDDEAVIQLRKIVVGQSPRAGETLTLEGIRVLERLKDQGVQLDRLRYTFPRQITVTRAFREIGIDELERAVSTFLHASDRQLEVKQLLLEKPVRVPPDSTGVQVLDVKTTNPGHIGVDFKVASESEDVRFQLKAVADEWRLLPIAIRPLRRGTIISGEDVELSRVNATAAGRDAMENLSDVVGRSITRDVGQGEIFRSNTVAIPPVVHAGARVTLLFRDGRLEATATGVALENGIAGQEIRVRNESSKKVIAGKVVEDGLVTVGLR